MSEPFPLRQESDRLPRSVLLTIAVTASVVSALAIAASTWLGRVWSPVSPRPAAQAPAQLFGIEQTLIDHSERGLSLQRRQRARLESYGWVDRDAGVAHVPIERAIDLCVERGR
jgi:hypothetical protein